MRGFVLVSRSRSLYFAVPDFYAIRVEWCPVRFRWLSVF